MSMKASLAASSFSSVGACVQIRLTLWHDPLMQILSKKSLDNHEPAPEFAALRKAAVVDVAVYLTFAPLSYSLQFLDGGKITPAFYERICQLGRGIIPIEDSDVPGAYP